MAIELSDKDAADMAGEIRELMCQYQPHERLADYQCGICSRRPETNHGIISHSSLCTGEKWINLLTPASKD